MRQKTEFQTAEAVQVEDIKEVLESVLSDGGNDPEVIITSVTWTVDLHIPLQEQGESDPNEQPLNEQVEEYLDRIDGVVSTVDIQDGQIDLVTNEIGPPILLVELQITDRDVDTVLDGLEEAICNLSPVNCLLYAQKEIGGVNTDVEYTVVVDGMDDAVNEEIQSSMEDTESFTETMVETTGTQVIRVSIDVSDPLTQEQQSNNLALESQGNNENESNSFIFIIIAVVVVLIVVLLVVVVCFLVRKKGKPLEYEVNPPVIESLPLQRSQLCSIKAHISLHLSQ